MVGTLDRISILLVYIRNIIILICGQTSLSYINVQWLKEMLGSVNIY